MLTMILADDEPVITRGIQKLLDWNALGISIIGVYEDGKSAMEAILAKRPDLALLDINMPGMDGIAILKNLRAFDITETAVIFISGFQDFAYARAALTYGAADYLLKPVIREELIRAIDRALEKKEADGGAAGSARRIGSSGSIPSDSPADAAGLENHAASAGDPSGVSLGKEKAGGHLPEEIRTGDASDAASGEASAPAQSGASKTAETSGGQEPPAETRYLTILADLVYPAKTSPQMKRLMEFSLRSSLSEILSAEDVGIVFEKDGNTVAVLRGEMGDEAFRKQTYRLWQKASEASGQKLIFFCSGSADSMQGIPAQYRACRDLSRYLFFAGELPDQILFAGQPVFAHPAGTKEIQEATAAVTNALLSHQEDEFRRAWDYFCRIICQASDGRREDACYYFCSTIRVIDAQMTAMHIPGKSPEMRELLEGGRAAADYPAMCVYFQGCMNGYSTGLKNAVEGNDRREIAAVQQYVEEHYREPVTLATAAELIHVNSFYFSSLFKKKTGQNFKDYVSSVRLRHAVALLLSSDQKLYEIAEAAGFRDVRALNEAFSKTYGETPAAYRKRILAGPT